MCRNLYLYVDEINFKKDTFFVLFSNVPMVLITQLQEDRLKWHYLV